MWVYHMGWVIQCSPFECICYENVDSQKRDVFHFTFIEQAMAYVNQRVGIS